MHAAQLRPVLLLKGHAPKHKGELLLLQQLTFGELRGSSDGAMHVNQHVMEHMQTKWQCQRRQLQPYGEELNYCVPRMRRRLLIFMGK